MCGKELIKLDTFSFKLRTGRYATNFGEMCLPYFP